MNLKLSIRCRRSRIVFTRILQIVCILYKKLKQPDIQAKVRRIREELFQIKELSSSYLPSELMDKRHILDKLSSYVFVSEKEKIHLLSNRETLLKSSGSELLNDLSTIFEFYRVQEDNYYSTLVRVKQNVDRFENSLVDEIERLDKNLNQNKNLVFNNIIESLRNGGLLDEKT